MQWFEHEVPIHPSSMTRWRKRIGEAGAEEFLKATIDAGLKLKTVKAFQLKHVNKVHTDLSHISWQSHPRH